MDLQALLDHQVKLVNQEAEDLVVNQAEMDHQDPEDLVVQWE